MAIASSGHRSNSWLTPSSISAGVVSKSPCHLQTKHSSFVRAFTAPHSVHLFSVCEVMSRLVSTRISYSLVQFFIVLPSG